MRCLGGHSTAITLPKPIATDGQRIFRRSAASSPLLYSGPHQLSGPRRLRAEKRPADHEFRRHRTVTTLLPEGQSGRPGAPIRVLHICRRFRPFVGGTEKSVHDLAVAQTEAGYRVTIVTLDRDTAGPTKGLPSRETLDGLEVVRLPGWGTTQVGETARPSGRSRYCAPLRPDR
jgi:hypothetical protein